MRAQVEGFRLLFPADSTTIRETEPGGCDGIG
jgi:hypothetical protein